MPSFSGDISPARWRWTTPVCWLLILAPIGILQSPRSQPHSPAPVDVPRAALPGVQLRLISRYAVGLHALLEDRAQEQMRARLQEEVWSAARTPAQRLRAVAVIGELGGADSALAKLRGLDSRVFQDDLWRDADTLTVIYRDSPGAVEAAARDRLLERHGWYAQLALSYGLPPGDPFRQAALRPAQRGFLALAALVLGALAAGVVGLVLLLVAASTLRGRPWRRYALGSPTGLTPEAPLGADRAGNAFLQAFVIYLAGTVALGIILSALWDPVPLPATWLSAAFVVLAILWPRFRGVSWRDLRLGLGWYRARSLWREPLAGIVGYVTGLPIVAAGVGLTLWLTRLAGAAPTHPIVRELTGGGVWHIAGLYLLACLWAPVVEETLFRGALYHHLRRRVGWIGSALIVGAVFAALHPQGWTAIPVLGAIGFVLGAIREWRGTLYASMTAHALNNVTALTVVLLVMA